MSVSNAWERPLLNQILEPVGPLPVTGVVLVSVTTQQAKRVRSFDTLGLMAMLHERPRHVVFFFGGGKIGCWMFGSFVPCGLDI